ncbi:type I secretion C-terminal target domain-containing protein [Micavibrio aeruginosavorus]|uniref:type I secretion C-terminal target domain-containing protein n=1 Tax=Micavibrio aeruginosavorus TaxID=349221 RepID=UPI003F4AA207
MRIDTQSLPENQIAPAPVGENVAAADIENPAVDEAPAASVDAPVPPVEIPVAPVLDDQSATPDQSIVDTLRSSAAPVTPSPKPAPVNEGFGYQSTVTPVAALYDDDLFALGVITDDDTNAAGLVALSGLSFDPAFRPADLYRPTDNTGGGSGGGGGGPPSSSYDHTINGTAGHDFISNLHIGTVTNLNPVGSPFFGPALFYFDHLPGQEYSWDGAVFTSTIDASTFDPYAVLPPAETYEIYGDDGTDFIINMVDDSLIDGGDGNNSIDSYGSGNTITAGNGNDLFYVSGDNNIIDGGEASDRIVVRGDNNTIDTGGSDIGHNMGSYYTSVSGNNNTVNGDDVEGWHALYGDDNIMNTYGGEDDITISGNRNTVDAGAGDDHLIIGGGNENNIYGGTGQDWLDFQAGSVDNVVHDFNTGEGDFIDVRDILSGYDQGVDDTNDFVQFIANGSDTDVYVSQNGDGVFTRLVTIVGGVGGASVDDLIMNGNLALADS